MACGAGVHCHSVSPGIRGTAHPPKLGFTPLFTPRYLLEQVKRREGFQLVMEVGMMLECGMGECGHLKILEAGMPQV